MYGKYEFGKVCQSFPCIGLDPLPKSNIFLFRVSLVLDWTSSKVNVGEHITKIFYKICKLDTINKIFSAIRLPFILNLSSFLRNSCSLFFSVLWNWCIEEQIDLFLHNLAKFIEQKSTKIVWIYTEGKTIVHRRNLFVASMMFVIDYQPRTVNSKNIISMINSDRWCED